MSEFKREIEPPAGLERRVVEALRTTGLIAPRRAWSPVSVIAAGVAIIAIFASGYAVGAWQAQRPADASSAPRFLLLLHETPATASVEVPEAQLVAEYAGWARDFRARGGSITGEKLEEAPGETLSGFFILEAPSLDAARAIARTSPHARYGGRIEVRALARIHP